MLRLVTVENGKPGEYTFHFGSVISGHTASAGAELLGVYLRELRRRRGESLRVVAISAGVSDAYISQVENNRRGKAPSIAVLRALAGHYEVALDTLLFVAGLRPEPVVAAQPVTAATDRQRLQVLLENPIFAGVGVRAEDLRWVGDEVVRAWMAFARALEEHVRKTGEGLEALQEMVTNKVPEGAGDGSVQGEVDHGDK